MPKLLKIDVEGYEMEVLSGASLTLPLVSALILEAHNPSLRTNSAAFLRQHGFHVTDVDGLLLADRERSELWDGSRRRS
jgi:hypothetical protein